MLHVGFCSDRHHLPFRHKPAPCLCSFSADILYLGGASCTMYSLTSRSSPTTAQILTSHSHALCLAFDPHQMHYAVGLVASYPSYIRKIRPPPLARPIDFANHLNMRGDHSLVSRYPHMILHNLYVFYCQRIDPMGPSRRTLDLRTSLDRAKRFGSGKRTSIPLFRCLSSV